jgi:hypothetical protein
MNVSRRPDWAHVRADARAGVSDFRQKRDDEKSLEGYEESDDI